MAVNWGCRERRSEENFGMIGDTIFLIVRGDVKIAITGRYNSIFSLESVLILILTKRNLSKGIS